MPNQRKPGKKLVGLWADDKEQNAIKALKERYQCSASKAILIAIASQVDPKLLRDLLESD